MHQPIRVELSSQPLCIAIGDFNNDTHSDIVVANNGTNNIMVLFGSGYGTFLGQITYFTGNNSQPCWVAVGDVNNDSRFDIVVANSGNDNVGVFLANDTGHFFKSNDIFDWCSFSAIFGGDCRYR